MNRSEYYETLKGLARDVRAKYGIEGFRVLPSDLKEILKAEGVHHLDLRKISNRFRGAYFFEPGNISVLLQKDLPRDPYAFTLAHELKHHLVDQGEGSNLRCTTLNIDAPLEIGAEVFAAELLFPDADFRREVQALLKPGEQITARTVISLKIKFDTTLSYQGIVKKLEYLKLVAKDSFKKVQWKKLEEEMNGIPIYKRLLSRRKKKQD